MGVESQTPSTEIQTPVSTETAPVSTTPSIPEKTEFSAQTATSEIPAWTPDFKFKAAGTEHEIPDMFRGLAKDQKTLDEVKRLHEKAYGLDSLVQNRDGLKKQLADLTPQLNEYKTVSQNFQRLSHFVENKDFDSFFSGLGIPEKDIIGWIQNKINLANAAPEVREQYEKNRQLTQSQYEQSQKLQWYEAQAQEYEQAKAYNTVTSEIANSAQDIANLYDTKMGQEGAFADYVINKGIQLTQALGKEPELGMVIGMVKNEFTKLGLIPNPISSTVTPGVSQQKPTIPVIPAGGQSPIKTPVRSMKDLLQRQAMVG